MSNLEKYYLDKCNSTDFEYMINYLGNFRLSSVDWQKISKNSNLTWKIVKNNICLPWDWNAISRHPNITFEIIIKNFNKSWNWDYVSANPNITWENIQNHKFLSWNWCFLSHHPNITWEIIQNNPDENWNWNCISRNPNITWEIIQNNPYHKWVIGELFINKMELGIKKNIPDNIILEVKPILQKLFDDDNIIEYILYYVVNL